MPMNRPFLTAQWRDLILANYVVDPSRIESLAPQGTELDFWQQKTYVSVVGFLFDDTRVLGLPIPFHRRFEEVNLRFYVRRHANGETRRAVCFVKELVPKRAIAWVARALYNENYAAVPMSHTVSRGPDDRSVSYRWLCGQSPYELSVRASGRPCDPPAESHEAFIAEHYWGYARQRDGGTVEYRVEHPPWRCWNVHDVRIDGDFGKLYGSVLGDILKRKPESVLLAEGSAISVSRGQRIG